MATSTPIGSLQTLITNATISPTSIVGIANPLPSVGAYKFSQTRLVHAGNTSLSAGYYVSVNPTTIFVVAQCGQAMVVDGYVEAVHSMVK